MTAVFRDHESLHGEKKHHLKYSERKKWGQCVFYHFISKHLIFSVFFALIFPCSYYIQWDIKQKGFSKNK